MIVVQPNAYQDDNRVTLEAIRALGPGAPEYEDVSRLARALVKHAPERMLWASNWPHSSAPKNKVPDDAVLLDLLLDWAPDEAVRNKILVDNPAKLYGFPNSTVSQVS